MNYKQIRSRQANWPAHVHFIESLVAIGRAKDLNEALKCSATLLIRYKGLHRCIIEFVLEIIATYPNAISDSTKDAFLHALRAKYRRSTSSQEYSDDSDHHVSEDARLLHLLSNSNGGATILVNFAIQLLFGRPSSSQLDWRIPELDRWLRFFTCSTLRVLDSSEEEFDVPE